MPKRNLREETENLLAQVRLKHPRRKTDCGALLAEISTATDFADRQRAATTFGLLKCRRGLKTLQRLIADLRPLVEPHPPYTITPEYNLLAEVIWAIGWMDTVQSHAYLAWLLRDSEHSSTRGFVLEAMAFEEKTFEIDLVLPFASEKANIEEILSAVYALEFRDYIFKRPKDCRKRIPPLLKHEHPNVRSFTLSLLCWDSAYRDIVSPLLNDVAPHVRQAATDALRQMDECDRWATDASAAHP